MVEICYRLPDQDEEVNAALFEQLDSVSKQWDLVVTGDFKEICSQTSVLDFNRAGFNEFRGMMTVIP